MVITLGHARRLLFGIADEEATFARRGFTGADPAAQQHLEQVGRTFLHGYHAALIDADPCTLGPRLNTSAPDVRGFAYEGAAMGLALLDCLVPWNRQRLQAFLDGPGAAHVYMVHVGAGWALARLRRRIDRLLPRLDPLLGWLAVDGYGFHEGYFHWPQFVKKQMLPRRLKGYALRVFDQGLGRSLWFVHGAHVDRIQSTVNAFTVTRQADLWSGVGLACAYAGGGDRAAIEALRTAAGRFWPQLAQGVTFAAKARRRAGNPALCTETACRVLCGLSSIAAAELTDTALRAIPAEGVEPRYEAWRRRIQAQFAEEVVIFHA